MNAAIEQIINNQALSEPQIKRRLPFPENYRSSGFIYVLSNPSMPGIYKIGMTRRTVAERVEELSRSTSTPTPFRLEAEFLSHCPLSDEQAIHRSLSMYKVSENREFFKCSLERIIDCCREYLALEVNQDLSFPAATNEIINLSSNENNEIDIDELLPAYLGECIGVNAFLLRIGEAVLSRFLKKNRVSVVIMPDSSLEFVRPIDLQKGETK